MGAIKRIRTRKRGTGGKRKRKRTGKERRKSRPRI